MTRLRNAHGLQPGLAVVLVGEDPASQVYVRNKGRQTLTAGMRSFEHKLPADVSGAELLALVAALNADPAVHGILVQLPLPKHLDTNAVIAAIDPDKDVDGLHVVNAGRLAAGLPGLVPCTPLGCVLLLKDVLPVARRPERGGGRPFRAGRQARWRSCCWRKTAPSPSPTPAPRDLAALCPHRRHHGRRDRPAGDDRRRRDQTRRHGDRCRHQPR